MTETVKMENRRKDKLIYIFSTIVLRFLFDRIYIMTIAPYYAYRGLEFSPTTVSAIQSWGLLLGGIFMTIPFLWNKKSTISHAAIFLFCFFVPWTSFIYCKAQPIDFVLCEAIYWFMIFFCLRISAQYQSQSIKERKNDEGILSMIVVVLSLSVLYISFVYAHFRFNFRLDNVYEMRMEARKFNLPLFLDYAWPAASNILPVAVVYYMSRKRWSLAILIAIVVLLDFSINGLKATLFRLILCFLFYFFIHGDIRKKILPYLTGFVGMGLLEYILFSSNFISSVILRRTFYVPALLDSLYYDLIQETGPIYFSHEINNIPITFYIGDLYFHDDEMRANNGLFSDAYMNLGLIGCLVYPIAYAILFNICESKFIGLKGYIQLYTLLLISMALRSSEFTTALLTHGLFLLILTMTFMPRGKSELYVN